MLWKYYSGRVNVAKEVWVLCGVLIAYWTFRSKTYNHRRYECNPIQFYHVTQRKLNGFLFGTEWRVLMACHIRGHIVTHTRKKRKRANMSKGIMMRARHNVHIMRLTLSTFVVTSIVFEKSVLHIITVLMISEFDYQAHVHPLSLLLQFSVDIPVKFFFRGFSIHILWMVLRV